MRIRPSNPSPSPWGGFGFRHAQDKRVREALDGLHRICPRVHFLGSYPRADSARPKIDDGFTDEAYDDAADWLESLGAAAAG